MPASNVRAEVELIIDTDHVTVESFRQALEDAIKAGRWVHVALPRVVHVREED